MSKYNFVNLHLILFVCGIRNNMALGEFNSLTEVGNCWGFMPQTPRFQPFLTFTNMDYIHCEMTEQQFNSILGKKETGDCLAIHGILEVYGGMTFKELQRTLKISKNRVEKAITQLKENNLIQLNNG